MEQNAADGGNRRYMLVQLPEKTGREEYPTIADLTKERLRRAGAKIKKEHEGTLIGRDTPLDTGFRVFKLDSANVKAWDPPTTDELQPGDGQRLIEDHVDAVKPDRSPEDLLWGALVNLGLPLDGRVDERQIDGRRTFVAGGGSVVASFDDTTITLQSGETLATGLADLIGKWQPAGTVTVLLLDAAFAGSDAAKVNLVENLRQALAREKRADGETNDVRVLSL